MKFEQKAEEQKKNTEAKEKAEGNTRKSLEENHKFSHTHEGRVKPKKRES